MSITIGFIIINLISNTRILLKTVTQPEFCWIPPCVNTAWHFTTAIKYPVHCCRAQQCKWSHCCRAAADPRWRPVAHVGYCAGLQSWWFPLDYLFTRWQLFDVISGRCIVNCKDGGWTIQPAYYLRYPLFRKLQITKDPTATLTTQYPLLSLLVQCSPWVLARFFNFWPSPEGPSCGWPSFSLRMFVVFRVSLLTGYL